LNPGKPVQVWERRPASIVIAARSRPHTRDGGDEKLLAGGDVGKGKGSLSDDLIRRQA
jgi:hypothetical protein